MAETEIRPTENRFQYKEEVANYLDSSSGKGLLMKINVTFDMTPEELRKLMGLPDVQEMQKEVFGQMMEKMKLGEVGYDPLSLYQPLLSGGLNAMTEFQKLLFSMMSSQSITEKSED